MLRFNEPQWKVDLIIEPLYELSIKSDSIRVQIREREKQRQSKKKLSSRSLEENVQKKN